MKEKKMDNPKEKISITADTKLKELLDRFPQLENFFMSISPAYKKLKNPVLRKTVARIATLEQVARVGNIPIEELLKKIRSFLQIAECEDDHTAKAGDLQQGEIPEFEIVETIDARPMLEQGAHPLNLVMTKLKQMNPGQGFILITPFIPAPLIDTARGQGYRAEFKKISEDQIENYFWKE
jgi:hypothetical protein